MPLLPKGITIAAYNVVRYTLSAGDTPDHLLTVRAYIQFCPRYPSGVPIHP